LASSTPATSAKSTLVSVSTYTFALLLPMLMKPPPPILSAKRRMTNSQIPMNTTAGTTQPRTSRRNVLSTTPLKRTSCWARSLASSGSTRVVTNRVLPSRGSLKLP